MKRLTIIGSTGSVGRNTLEVVKHLDGRLKVFALGAHSSVDTLAEQVSEHRPEIVAIADSASVAPFVKACGERGLSVPELLTGTEGLARLAALGEADVVVSAAVGAAGLEPTYSALVAGHTVALANKEAMVLAGELLRKTAAGSGGVILPVDSEHNAIDQCLRAGSGSEVGRLILTASGGPFLDRPRVGFCIGHSGRGPGSSHMENGSPNHDRLGNSDEQGPGSPSKRTGCSASMPHRST